MIRFIVDSTFCLTKEYVELHKIKIVNLKLILDGIESDEGYPDEWEEFYTRLKSSRNFPTTSQPNPQAYIEAIEAIYKEDPAAEIIIMTIAGALSGTINSATVSTQGFENKKIAAVDSFNVSACSQMMLEEAVNAAQKGATHEEILALCEQLKSKISVQFIPDTMEYLQRGGRVGKLSAILASIISIKPIFDFRNNVVSVTARTLGLMNGIISMIKKLPQKIKKLYVCYIYDNKNIPQIVKKVSSMLGIEQPEVFAIDPVFGVHVGIGAIGLACLEG